MQNVLWTLVTEILAKQPLLEKEMGVPTFTNLYPPWQGNTPPKKQLWGCHVKKFMPLTFLPRKESFFVSECVNYVGELTLKWPYCCLYYTPLKIKTTYNSSILAQVRWKSPVYATNQNVWLRRPITKLSFSLTMPLFFQTASLIWVVIVLVFKWLLELWWLTGRIKGYYQIILLRLGYGF